MIVEITDIKSKTDNIISSYKAKELSNEEYINRLLDRINEIQKPIKQAIKIIESLDEILLLTTWAEIRTVRDKEDLKYILDSAEQIHKRFIRDYAFLHKTLRKDMFGNVLKDFKNTIDDFEDSFFEVKNVFFKVRKNNKLVSLINSLF